MPEIKIDIECISVRLLDGLIKKVEYDEKKFDVGGVTSAWPPLLSLLC